PPMDSPTDPTQLKLRVFDVGGRMVVAPAFSSLSEGILADPPGDGFDPGEFPGADYRDQATGANWIEVRRIVGVYPEDLWVEGHGTWGHAEARAGWPVEHDYVWQ